jgi:hypothetical protein
MGGRGVAGPGRHFMGRPEEVANFFDYLFLLSPVILPVMCFLALASLQQLQRHLACPMTFYMAFLSL